MVAQSRADLAGAGANLKDRGQRETAALAGVQQLNVKVVAVLGVTEEYHDLGAGL